MLSWIRTATTLITFGFSIEQFFRIAEGRKPEDLIGPKEFWLLMISIGLVALLLAATFLAIHAATFNTFTHQRHPLRRPHFKSLRAGSFRTRAAASATA